MPFNLYFKYTAPWKNWKIIIAFFLYVYENLRHFPMHIFWEKITYFWEKLHIFEKNCIFLRKNCIFLRKIAYFWEKLHVFEKNCIFLREKCMHLGKNTWLQELKFSNTYKKITIELLLKLKSRIENACIIAARAPRSLQ